jgi:hypothetical protein
MLKFVGYTDKWASKPNRFAHPSDPAREAIDIGPNLSALTNIESNKPDPMI